MYLLNKVIQLRENSSPDHEKPFLEHLEDLRVMVTRVVLTLLVSVVICFTFQKQMMELLRKPVDTVWVKQLESKLPTNEGEAPKVLTVERWEEAKELERGSLGLSEAERDRYFSLHPDQELVFHARSVSVLRAVLALPEDSRKAFLEGLDAGEDMKRQVEVLLKTSPSPESDGRGNLRLMSALKPTETFMLSMKISFFSGIVAAFPLLLFFILQFVLPGLHEHEKKVMWPALAIGFGLFLAGVSFAYLVVLPRALMFFYEWGGSLGVSNDWRIGEYISFATQFTLLFGVAFELPVLVMVLVKLGLLSYETMSNTRAYAVLSIVVIAALLTPTPDALTLTLMALPMIVLYEICIWLAWLDRKRNREKEETEAREEEERRALAYAAGGAAGADDAIDEVDPLHDHDPYAWDHDSHDHDWSVDHHGHDEDFGMETGDDGHPDELDDSQFEETPGLPEDRGPEESKSDDDEPSPPNDGKS